MFSKQFDDIYFSTQDGLAESRHTYLVGNNLPTTWQDKSEFHILELGFGSGLNFLATLHLWRETAKPSQRLRYTAVELYPLPWQDIELGLSPWRSELAVELALLGDAYVAQANIRHVVSVDANVTLDLSCMDVTDALPQIEDKADAIYLDGFAPAKNPEMWTAAVFAQLARLCKPGTSFATFTVARAVRDNAAAVGFRLEKRKGYGRKADMLTGVFVPDCV